MAEVIYALGGRELVQEFADRVLGRLTGARAGLAEEHFELREELFDGIEVRTMGGRGLRIVPRASMASRAPRTRCAERLSQMIMSPAANIGYRNSRT